MFVTLSMTVMDKKELLKQVSKGHFLTSRGTLITDTTSSDLDFRTLDIGHFATLFFDQNATTTFCYKCAPLLLPPYHGRSSNQKFVLPLPLLATLVAFLAFCFRRTLLFYVLSFFNIIEL